ncbi:MAG: TRAP transporter small permease [Bilophila wadsworthia]
MLMAQVVVRFAFGHGLTFSEELCRSLPSRLFRGEPVACRGAHPGDRAHPAPAPVRVGLPCWRICSGSPNATVIYQGALLIDSMSPPMVSGSMLLDLRYVYFAVPAAFTLQSFRILQRWYRHFRGGVSILGQQQEEV